MAPALRQVWIAASSCWSVFWAILKWGRLFALSTGIPDDRLDYILRDSRADVIIRHQGLPTPGGGARAAAGGLDDESLRHELSC